MNVVMHRRRPLRRGAGHRRGRSPSTARELDALLDLARRRGCADQLTGLQQQGARRCGRVTSAPAPGRPAAGHPQRAQGRASCAHILAEAFPDAGLALDLETGSVGVTDVPRGPGRRRDRGDLRRERPAQGRSVWPGNGIARPGRRLRPVRGRRSAGRPGIFSARWAGTHGDDVANLDLLLAQLGDVPDEHRGAHFVCAAALVAPAGTERVEQGRLDGTLRTRPARHGRLRLRPDPPAGRHAVTTAELSAEEKNRSATAARLRRTRAALARLSR